MEDGPVLSANKVADDAKMAIHNLGAFQLLEYQTDVQRCRFDKPSLLLRSYKANTSALLMLELGLMPVVTTMARPTLRGHQSFGHRQKKLETFHKCLNVRGSSMHKIDEDSSFQVLIYLILRTSFA